jgi:hypothetical protein
MRNASRSLLVLALAALTACAARGARPTTAAWVTGRVRDGGHAPDRPWAGMFIGLRIADRDDCSGPGPHTWSAADGAFTLPRWTPPAGGGAATMDVAICLGWVRGDSTGTVRPVLRLPASSAAVQLDCFLHDAQGRPGCVIIPDTMRRTPPAGRAG